MAEKSIGEMSLYDLEGEILKLADAYQDLADTTPPDWADTDEGREKWEADREALAGWLAEQESALAEAFGAKADAWVKVYWIKTRRAQAAKAEKLRIQDIQVRAQASADRIKATLFRVMESTGIGRFETDTATLAISKNGGNPKIEWDGKTQIPEGFAAPISLSLPVLRGALALVLPVDGDRFDAKWALFLQSLGIRRDALQPNTQAVLAHFRETGEIPDGFSITHGKHLRIS